MYHTLLTIHLFAAFALAIGIVVYSAFVLGSPVNRATRLVAEITWGLGGLGTLVFGVWLALYLDAYKLYDGWIIAALVLWVLATGSGARASRGVQPAGDDSPVAIDRRTAFAHWMRTVYFVALLVVMVWKPGA
jgi:uncharacterized membrane protein